MPLSPNPAAKGGGGATANPAARPSASAPRPTSGGGLTANPASSKGAKKKGGGLFGGALKLGGSLLGEVGEFLSAPQQALFKGVRGAGQIATGDVKQGLGTLASAGKSAAMFTLPGSSALLEEKAPVSATQALQPFGVKKLAPGLDTGLSLVADPLNAATFGVGPLAKQALKVAGPEIAEQIAKQGLRKGLTAAEKSALKDALVSSAAKAGARSPEKTAARQFKALSARGQGGVGVRVPFTGLGAPIVPGRAVGAIGEAAGATAAKKFALDSKPVRALGRGLIPLRATSEAVGSAASEKLGTAARRRTRSAAALAEDWEKRVVAAQTDYAQQTGKAFTEADDEFVHAVLEAGPEAMDAAKAARPELARVIDTDHAVRVEQAEMQRARGLLLGEDEIRAGVTARKQAPVRGRIAARDEEIESLKTAPTPDPVPRSAAQERRAGALAERVRRADLTEAGELARGERLLGQSADEQRKAVAKAQARKAAAKSQEQQTIARFDLENAQRAERAVDRRINELLERNLRDEGNLERIAQDVLDDPNIITDSRYLHRVYTEEGLKAMDKADEAVRRSGGSVASALNQASLKMRTVAREYTSNQINDAIRVIKEGGTVGDVELANAVKGIAQQLKPGEKLIHESATLSLLDRGHEAAKAIAAADFVKDLRGIVVDGTDQAILLSADDVAALKLAGGTLPDGFVEFNLPGMGTFHAHKAVKAEISGALGRLEEPDGLRKLFDTLDKWWRSQVTASLPGGIPFATRNARTNVMLMWLSGTNVLKYMKEGLKLQRSVSRVYKAHAADVADLGVPAAMRKHLGETSREFKVWDYARENGVIGDGYYQVDLGGLGGVSKTGSLPRRAVRFGFGTKGAAAVKGRQLNSWIEEHARLSQFLSDVDRYGDLETALHRTQDVLFDYGSLTPTERKIKRWGMPFYTFARKNLPGQVRRFVESPGRVALPEKLADATTDPLPEGSPEYQERQGSRVSRLPGLLGLVTNPERPLHAAAETLDPLFQLAAGRGQLGLRGVASNLGGVPGAPAKAIGEQAVGRSLFTGFNLPKAADERQRIALQTAIPSLSRAWPVTTRLSVGAEGRAATEAQQRKLAAPGLAQALAMLGVNLQPPDKKEMARQKRLARAAKAAEKG